MSLAVAQERDALLTPQLRDFNRLGALVSGAGAVAAMLFGVAFGTALPWILAGAAAINVAAHVVAFRYATAGRLHRAVYCNCAGMWVIALGLSLVGLPAFSLVVAHALIPIIAAVPYVSAPVLLRLTVIAAGVVAAGSCFFIAGAPFPANAVTSASIYLPAIAAGNAIRSLLRIKELHDTVALQAAQLPEWNVTLTRRVEEQVAEVERLGRLKRFLAPQVAEVIAKNESAVLTPHRRRVAVAFVDLRGFTAVAESAEPEELMQILADYHLVTGRTITEHEGTLERFAGDGLVIVFNDPVEVPDPEARAVRMAVAIAEAAQGLRQK